MRKVSDGGDWVRASDWSEERGCDYCSYPFTWWPVGIPVKWCNSDVFYCYGHFCTFNCALSHLRRKSGPQQLERESFLSALWQHVYLDPSRGLKRAPPLPKLVRFGGSLEPDQWRDGLDIMPHPDDWSVPGNIRRTVNNYSIYCDVIKDAAYWVGKTRKRSQPETKEGSGPGAGSQAGRQGRRAASRQVQSGDTFTLIRTSTT